MIRGGDVTEKGGDISDKGLGLTHTVHDGVGLSGVE